MLQTVIIAGGGVALASAIAVLARQGKLTLRYTLGWMTVAACILLLAVAAPLVSPVARLLGMTETGLLLALASGVLLLISVQLSVTASGLYARLRDVAEAYALLEQRVRV